MRKKRYRVYGEERKPAVVFLSIALVLFLGVIGFFTWNTVNMRRYELEYVRVEGVVTDVERQIRTTSGHGGRIYYFLEISYTFGGEEYSFLDRTGYNSPVYNRIGTSTEVYVDPQNPSSAEQVSSSDYVSVICACFFAFFCATYAAGMNVLLSAKGSSFKRRVLFVWGAEILLGVILLLLFWLGLPNSGFGEVFTRIGGAVGVTVVTGLVLLVTFLDALISHKLRKWKKDGRVKETEQS